MIVEKYLHRVTGVPRIFCMGEALLDIIFENNQPKYATPGGSMLNSAISLARMGNEVYMISDLGNDHTGQIIIDFLESNLVSTRYIHRYNTGHTAVALAFLDENRNAKYTFYKDFPEDRFPGNLPDICPGDILLFGSFYSITAAIYNHLHLFISEAAAKGALVIYDPNFRQPHLHELELLRPMILKNIRCADIVKGSDEDFGYIFGASDFQSAFRSVENAGCTNLIYTRNKEDVEAVIDGLHLRLPVPQITPVSTVGAGDAFNAGIIHGLLSFIGKTGTDDIILLQTGIEFATKVCMSLENYLPLNN